ncbi:MAG: hydantoinase/oxoprolinase family protein [Betaproteobacteria bacterium]|nr:hydantoinase/oxoprolinase family protein [Betaproteobacteria bacterium]
MGKLITIDNGGTLTDICVIEGANVWRTKTLTTPYDLSKCFFEGLRQAAIDVLGKDDLTALLRDTESIRYSTTQGTNALVERKGPRLGLMVGASDSIANFKGELFEALVGERIVAISNNADDAAEAVFAQRVATGINALCDAGASRIVVSIAEARGAALEERIRNIILATYPAHLLGAVPVLFASEIVVDDDYPRRTWTALFNAFLHPAMEGFLYHSEHRLREHKIRAPFLIFRNDGGSARVAKTTAIKTYGSGPRAGLEAVKALARHNGFTHAVALDIGGTTTDLGEVRDGQVQQRYRGEVEGFPISFPFCDIKSIGVGGSSIIRVVNGQIQVGPESVGSEPGPACFGLGGQEATITDIAVLLGLLNPQTFFGGRLTLDAQRARAVVQEKIAGPLGVGLEAALARASAAWVNSVAEGIDKIVHVQADTTLVAFGGCGPLFATAIAERAGVGKVLVPRLAAVFSAFGIAFSDITQEYQALVSDVSAKTLAEALQALKERGRRDMAAENIRLADCQIETVLVRTRNGNEEILPLDEKLEISDASWKSCTNAVIHLKVSRRIAHASFPTAADCTASDMLAAGTRRILDADWRELPCYQVEAQRPGATAAGPAVLEESFWTALVAPGWRIQFNASGDVLLTQNS